MSYVLTKTFHKVQANVFLFIFVIKAIVSPHVGRVLCIHALILLLIYL